MRWCYWTQPSTHYWFSANKVSAVMSVDTTEEEYVLKRATVDNYHTSFKSSDATLSFSGSSIRTSSTSSVSTSAVLDASFTSSFKISKTVESTKEVVKNMHYESACDIYVY